MQKTGKARSNQNKNHKIVESKENLVQTDASRTCSPGETANAINGTTKRSSNAITPSISLADSAERYATLLMAINLDSETREAESAASACSLYEKNNAMRTSGSLDRGWHTAIGTTDLQ